jgi:hypothetical protein
MIIPPVQGDAPETPPHSCRFVGGMLRYQNFNALIQVFLGGGVHAPQQMGGAQQIPCTPHIEFIAHCLCAFHQLMCRPVSLIERLQVQMRQAQLIEQNELGLAIVERLCGLKRLLHPDKSLGRGLPRSQNIGCSDRECGAQVCLFDILYCRGRRPGLPLLDLLPILVDQVEPAGAVFAATAGGSFRLPQLVNIMPGQTNLCAVKEWWGGHERLPNSASSSERA